MPQAPAEVLPNSATDYRPLLFGKNIYPRAVPLTPRRHRRAPIIQVPPDWFIHVGSRPIGVSALSASPLVGAKNSSGTHSTPADEGASSETNHRESAVSVAVLVVDDATQAVAADREGTVRGLTKRCHG